MIGKKPEGRTAQEATMPVVLADAQIFKEEEILEMLKSLLPVKRAEHERCRCPRCNHLLAYNPNTKSYLCLDPDCSLFHYREGEKG